MRGAPGVSTVPLAGGMPTQLFDGLAVTPHVSPDGTLLVYGTPDAQNGRTITDFAWSRDGKRLAISRSVTTNDIVLFKGLRH